jgi:hypothetical protein
MASGNSFAAFYSGYHTAARDRAERAPPRRIPTPAARRSPPQHAAWAVGARFFRANRPMPDWVHVSPSSWAADPKIFVDDHVMRWPGGLLVPSAWVDKTAEAASTIECFIGAESFRRTRISITRCGTRNWRRRASRASGRTEQRAAAIGERAMKPTTEATPSPAARGHCDESDRTHAAADPPPAAGSSGGAADTPPEDEPPVFSGGGKNTPPEKTLADQPSAAPARTGLGALGMTATTGVARAFRAPGTGALAAVLAYGFLISVI